MVPTPQRAETPLPIMQMFALAVVLLNESFSATMLLPYVGLLIAHIQNRPPEESGYVSGLLIGVFMFGQVITSKYWGYISDKYGRRVPLLFGLLTSGFMMLGFGLSSHIWTAIIFRFFHGLFNGNVLVAKTVLADILDKTNEAKGFTLVSLTYGFGTLIGPAVGGLLYDPANSEAMHWVGFSQTGLFARFPGLLPAVVVFLYTNFAMFVCTVFVKESNPNAQPLPRWVMMLLPCFWWKRHSVFPPNEVNYVVAESAMESSLTEEKKHQKEMATTAAGENPILMHELSNENIVIGVKPLKFEERDDPLSSMDNMVVELEVKEGDTAAESVNAPVQQETAKSFGFKEAFLNPVIRDVLIIYMILSSADMAFGETFPLWAIAKSSVGGLDFNSDVVGLFILSNSVPCVTANLLFHVACRTITDKMVLWRIALTHMAFAVLFIPLASYVPRVGQFAVVLLCCFVRQWFSSWAFCLITLFTAHTAPPGCLGRMYGINQSCGAMMRCAIPVLVTPIFAWSISGTHIPPFNHMFVFVLASILFASAAILSVGIKVEEHHSTDVVVEEETLHGAEEGDVSNSGRCHSFLWEHHKGEDEERGGVTTPNFTTGHMYKENTAERSEIST